MEKKLKKKKNIDAYKRNTDWTEERVSGGIKYRVAVSENKKRLKYNNDYSEEMIWIFH